MQTLHLGLSVSWLTGPSSVEIPTKDLWLQPLTAHSLYALIYSSARTVESSAVSPLLGFRGAGTEERSVWDYTAPSSVAVSAGWHSAVGGLCGGARVLT